MPGQFYKNREMAYVRNKDYNPIEFAAWNHMHHRRKRKNRAVVEEWSSFNKFLEDMGKAPKDHGLKRIDSTLPYGPENCKWEPYTEEQLKEQSAQRNKAVKEAATNRNQPLYGRKLVNQWG